MFNHPDDTGTLITQHHRGECGGRADTKVENCNPIQDSGHEQTCSVTVGERLRGQRNMLLVGVKR